MSDNPALTRIMVISLDSALERRSRFAMRAEDAGLEWRFFDAHRQLDPRLAYDPAHATRIFGRELLPAELGCYSSHAALWCDLIASDHQQYVVLEDDVIVDWKCLKRLVQHDFAAEGVGYVRLYYKRPTPFATLRTRYISRELSLIRLWGKAYGTQGYIITRAGAERLLANCRAVRRPIDDQMDRYWEHGVPNLSLFPFPILEEAVASDIGAERFERPRSARSFGFRWRALGDRAARLLARGRFSLGGGR